MNTEETCFYCKKDDQLRKLMVEIAPMDYSTLYLNRDQTHKGRAIVAFHTHKDELFELDDLEREGFMRDVARAAEALKITFDADKINYAIYGDIVSHLHFHLVPKFQGSIEWGEAFTNSPESKVHEEESNLSPTIRNIRAALSVTAAP